jgi:uncharacterized damage-inducible protein DinB
MRISTFGETMKALTLLLLLSASFVSALLVNPSAAFAQQKAPEGIWEGYGGEWMHVSQQLIALAEATPAEKFAYRPTPGVRSTSEVYMHLVIANFYLLSVTGPKMPADLDVSNVEKAEKSVTSKAEVIAWLKRSLEAVKMAHASVTPKDLQRKVKIADREATVDGMYLRIIVHANEHMGQLIAYARMSGVKPPWAG